MRLLRELKVVRSFLQLMLLAVALMASIIKTKKDPWEESKARLNTSLGFRPQEVFISF